MNLEFSLYDVFTSNPLAGNPLAVFADAAEVSLPLMQKIAREMNLSETSFITRKAEDDKSFDVRIFTPAKEIPFAGHPTVGTAFHLFSTMPNCDQLTLNLVAGAATVWAERQETLFVYFKPPPASLGAVVEDRQFLCDLTGLDSSDISDLAPVQVAGTGTNYLLVPVNNIDTMERASCNQALLVGCEEKYDFDKLTVFTRQGYESSSTFSTRVFAPLHGVPEDPATGSSSSALTYYLRIHNAIEDTGNEWFAIDQGYSIDRKSTIFARANCVEGVVEVRIGGNTTRIGSGALEI